MYAVVTLEDLRRFDSLPRRRKLWSCRKSVGHERAAIWYGERTAIWCGGERVARWCGGERPAIWRGSEGVAIWRGGERAAIWWGKRKYYGVLRESIIGACNENVQ